MTGLVVRGGRVVDPANGVDAVLDVAVADGVVVAVGPTVDVPGATVVDATGQLVLPGLVDLHVHLSSESNGHVGHRMLARAGVTTALDLLGEVGDVLDLAGRRGCGLAVGCVDGLDPRRHFGGDTRPGRGRVRDAIAAACRRGAIGVKLHVEHGFTPDVAETVVEEADRLGAWVAIHCGSPATGSTLSGMRETVELVGGRPAHIAHVNSYCRGVEAEPLVEAMHAIDLLRSVPQAVTESYLSELNGTSARLVGGLPLPRVRSWLAGAGYRPDEQGLVAAIGDGWAQIPVPTHDGVELRTGGAGVDAWRAAGSRTGLCLRLNPPLPGAVLAAARGPGGGFDVRALATDGGGIPRNTTISAGLALVDAGLLSVADLVAKASAAGARALGLPDKGHLGVGAAADLVVVDPERRRATLTVAAANVVWAEGHPVLERPSTALVTAAGRSAAVDAGCAVQVIDLAASGYRSGG